MPDRQLAEIVAPLSGNPSNRIREKLQMFAKDVVTESVPIYGPIMQTLLLPPKKGEPLEWACANLQALIVYMAKQCSSYRALFDALGECQGT